MTDKEKALALIEAYFDESKDILVKDEKHGVRNWVSISDKNYWTYLGEFIKNIDCYRIIDNDEQV